jgi:hypothetical protein
VNRAENALFGSAVAVRGDVAIVGAQGDGLAGVGAGAAYIYRLIGGDWEFEQTLVASDAQTGDGFGFSVAIDGGVALVGAVSDDDQGQSSGAAYVFRFDGAQWVEEQKLRPPALAIDFHFGWSVALAGEVAVVGAPVLPYPPDETGFAYVFRYNGAQWALERTLEPGEGGADQQYGISVATDGQRVVVGARWSSVLAPFAGAAYVYAYGGAWTLERRLLAADGGQSDQFGHGVALDGDTVIVGAPQPWGGPGAAYYFRRNGASWTQRQKLTPESGLSNESFGAFVAVAGERLVVGSPQTYVGPGRAFAYWYDGSAWSQRQELVPDPLAGPQGSYGAAVSVHGDTAFVGARAADTGCEENSLCNSGAAYVYSLAGGCPCPADLSGDGVVDLGDLSLLLASFGTATGAEPEQGDLDLDGDVDLTDLSLLLSEFGSACPI